MIQADRRKQRLKADKLWSQVIRSRDEVCQHPCRSCNGPLQAAHIIGRARYATRWDLANGLALCAGCHLYFTMRPEEWHEWIVKRIGQAAYDRLYERSLMRFSPDYPLLLLALKQDLAGYEAA